MTALLLFVSSTALGLLAAQAPAWAAEPIHIHVSESGFSPHDVPARVGDYLIFTLEPSASVDHTVSWDDPSICAPLAGVPEGPCWPELRFYDDTQKCSWRDQVLPRTRCILVRKPGEAFYYDKFLPRPNTSSYHGRIRVAGLPTTTSSTVRPTTTTTVAAPGTTTTTGATTTTTSPTTTTTAATPIRPQLISDPPPATATTTTTATKAQSPPPPARPGGASGSKGNDKDKNKAKDKAKEKDKGKAKDGAAETLTTAAPTADTLPPDLVFDPASLTPGFVTVPDTSVGSSSEDEVAIDAAAVASLLDPQKTEDDGNGPMLWTLGTMVTALAGLGGRAWLTRASRYDPA